MKIEKISDAQIRVTLNNTDLQDRDIKLGELAYGSVKAQALFKDMMLKAYEDFGFETENIPLMIEAVPLSAESIMIVVTKVQDPSEIEEKLDTLGSRPTHKSFKEALTTNLLDFEEGIQYIEETSSQKTSVEQNGKTIHLPLFYRFDNFEEVSSATKRIEPVYFGENSLYKYNDKYFLVLYPNQKSKGDSTIVGSLLEEFGKMGKSSTLNESFLLEHGKLLIPSHAVEILSKY
jgi:adapter protein MecA 1/2